MRHSIAACLCHPRRMLKTIDRRLSILFAQAVFEACSNRYRPRAVHPVGRVNFVKLITI